MMKVKPCCCRSTTETKWQKNTKKLYTQAPVDIAYDTIYTGACAYIYFTEKHVRENKGRQICYLYRRLCIYILYRKTLAGKQGSAKEIFKSQLLKQSGAKMAGNHNGGKTEVKRANCTSWKRNGKNRMGYLPNVELTHGCPEPYRVRNSSNRHNVKNEGGEMAKLPFRNDVDAFTTGI